MDRTTKHTMMITVVIGLLLVLTACTAGSDNFSGAEPAGFFAGFFHGIIAPFTLIWGIFDKSVKIYEVMNSGWWYDLGFLLGLGALSGGGSATACRG